MHLFDAGRIQDLLAACGGLAAFLGVVLGSAGLPLPGEATLLAAACAGHSHGFAIEGAVDAAADRALPEG